MFVCHGNSCPSLAGLEKYQPRQTSRLYAADGRLIAAIGTERRTLATLDQIPKQVQDAFVIVEDKRFYSHGGIDFLRIFGAGFANLRAGGIAQGFSTITMQLARNLFPERLNAREKTLGRKLREAKVARAIEAKYTKDRILELYLNQIYLGNGAFGVETASERYFGRPVRDLNLSEAATLAALPKGPERYNPRRFPDRAVQRRNLVLDLMRRAGRISDADASLARAYPLRLAHRTGSTGELAPYFVEYVRRLLDEKFGQAVYEQGMKVYTTLDLDLQGSAERALDRLVVAGGQRRVALPAGRVHRDGSAQRRRARARGRPRLRRLEIRPRHAGEAPTRFDVQADRLLHRDPERPSGQLHHRRRAHRARADGFHQAVDPGELRPEVRGSDPDAQSALHVAQPSRDPPRHGDRRGEHRVDGQALRHHDPGAALSVDQHRVGRRVPDRNGRGIFDLRA